MIRIDALGLCAQPVDMRPGADRLLASVVAALGQAHARHGDLFANARATRIELRVHDGLGIWCAARRLHAGRLVWAHGTSQPAVFRPRAFNADVSTSGLSTRRGS